MDLLNEHLDGYLNAYFGLYLIKKPILVSMSSFIIDVLCVLLMTLPMSCDKL